MRELGELDISIGTSLAFESGEAKYALSKVDNLYVNVRTLIRNIVDAHPKEDNIITKSNLVVNELLDELKKIIKVVSDINTNRAISFVLYFPSYDGLAKRFKMADIKVPKTQKQKDMENFINEVVKTLNNKIPKSIKFIDYTIPSFSGECLILTHHPIDIAASNNINRISLLESYTGLVKPLIIMNSKLTNGKDLWNIPFNIFTIQIFGDKRVNFYSASKGIVKLVTDLALRYKWTTSTKMERIRFCIKNDNRLDAVSKLGLIKYLN